MTTNINNFVLNDVNEPANWSTTERTLLAAIVGKLPNADAVITAASRHGHAVLISPDESITNVVSCDNTGNTSFYNNLYVKENALLYMGDINTDYAYLRYISATDYYTVYSTKGIELTAAGGAMGLSAAGRILISPPQGHGVSIRAGETPHGVLEVGDGTTTLGVIGMMSQDDESVDGLLIRNATYSAVSYNIGLHVVAMDNGNAEINSDYDLIIDVDSGDCKFTNSQTLVATVNALGVLPAADATIHARAQTAAPTTTTAGALWLDTDAGGNGHLMCYANGGWRTVAAL
jgi:hypothetical protein